MKLSNIFTLLFGGFVLAGTTSCIEEVEYTPAEPVALAPYYFSTGNTDRYDLDEDDSSFTILLGRLDDKEELVLPIERSGDALNIEGINIPESVTFAPGESTVNLKVTFDVSKMEKRREYKLDLKINGVENTPYFLGDLAMTLYYNPWTNLGKGIYVDNIVGSIFSDVTTQTYEVDIQEHPTTKGYYRLVNPYKSGIYPLNLGMNYPDHRCFVYINATNPEAVYVETSNTGMCVNAGYGYIEIASTAYINMTDGEETLEEQIEKELVGTLDEKNKNIVITNGLIDIAMTLYSGGAWAFKNGSVSDDIEEEGKNKEFRVVLPGGKMPSDWEEIGFCTYTDGFAGPFMTPAVNNNTYQVMVERNKKSGIYRIVDPFGPNSGYTTSLAITNNYITFDVTNPKCVIVGNVETPLFNLLKGGRFYTTTEADYEILNSEITTEELAEAGIGGTFENNVIRIPGDQIMGYWASKPNNFIYATTPVDVVLDLGTAVSPTAASK